MNLEYFLHQIKSTNALPALATAPGHTRWYFDSACCNHMTSSSPAFSSISFKKFVPFIPTANCSLMKVSHHDSVSLPNLRLFDTYHVSKIIFNLISVGQFCDLGYTVTFSSTGCSVQNPQT